MKSEVRVCLVKVAEVACSQRKVMVAVIVRGSRWLDGILCKHVLKDNDILNYILSSKYFAELKVIIVPHSYVKLFKQLKNIAVYSEDDVPREFTRAKELAELIVQSILTYLKEKA